MVIFKDGGYRFPELIIGGVSPDAHESDFESSLKRLLTPDEIVVHAHREIKKITDLSSGLSSEEFYERVSSVINEGFDSFLDGLGDTFDFNNLSGDDLAVLIHFSGYFSAKIVDRLPEIIETSINNDKVWRLFYFLSELGYTGRIAERLSSNIDIFNLSDDKYKVLVGVAQIYPTEMLNRLPDSIDVSNIDAHAHTILFSLIANKLEPTIAQGLFDNLNNNLDLGSMNEHGRVFLVELAVKLGLEKVSSLFREEFVFKRQGLFLKLRIVSNPDLKVLRYLPDKFDLESIDEEIIWLTRVALEKGFGKYIIKLLPTHITLSSLDEKAIKLLKSIADSGQREVVFKKLPPKINLLELTDEMVPLFRRLITHTHADEFLNSLGTGIEISQLSIEVVRWIYDLCARLNRLEYFNEIFENDLGTLRQSIDISSFHLKEQVGPYLHEQIKNFPIISGSIKKTPGGWYRGVVMKDGSETHVFFKLDEEFKLLFRNSKIHEDRIKTYKAVVDVLPDYVSSSSYPELNGEQARLNNRIGSVSFREVYAGPSLASFDKFKVPNLIRKSIDDQKKYIFWMLAKNNINHGHTHDGNFNVRFLLTNGEEEKVLSFDLNYAIQLAQNKGMTITPIVTLRDWDQGELLLDSDT